MTHLINRIYSFFQKQYIHWRHPLPYPKIIVLGNQKSGTSAFAQLLSQRGHLSKRIDFPNFPLFFDQLLTKELHLKTYISQYAHYWNKDLIIEPSLTFLVHELVDIYPKSNYIFIVRHPLYNIRSILDRVGVDPQQMPNTIEKVHPHANEQFWKNVLTGKHLHPFCTPKPHDFIYNLAQRWNFATEQYLHIKNKAHLVKYEDFVANKQNVIDDVCQQLKLPLLEDISHDLHKAYQPKGLQRQTNVENLFTSADLQRIQEICKVNMNEMGYTKLTKD